MESFDGFDFNDLELLMEELELEMNHTNHIIPPAARSDTHHTYHHREGKLVISLDGAIAPLKRCLTFRKYVGEVVVTVDGSRQRHRIAHSSSSAEFIFDIYEYFGALKIVVEVFQYKFLSKQLIGRVQLCLHDVVNMQEKNEVRLHSTPGKITSITRINPAVPSSCAPEFWGCMQTLSLGTLSGSAPLAINFAARYISLQRCLATSPLTSYSDFHFACQYSTSAVVADLLELFSRKSLLRQIMSLRDTSHNLTPLQFAIAAHNLPVVKILLMRVGNCCFLHPSPRLPTPFHTAIEYDCMDALLIMLRFMSRYASTIPYSPLLYTYNDHTILQYAVLHNNPMAVRIMFPFYSWSELVARSIVPLHMACCLGHLECAGLIMTKMSTAEVPVEASSNSISSLQYALRHVDEEGVTALMGACRVGADSLLPNLLRYSDYKSQCKQGNTCLHYAAMNGHVRVIANLLEHDASEWKRVYSQHRRTILMHMTLPKKFTLMRNNSNQLAIDIACQHQSQDIVKLLQAHDSVYHSNDIGSSKNSSRASSDEPDIDDVADNNMYAFASKRYFSRSSSSGSNDEKDESKCDAVSCI